jgi:hypothetical protein
MSCTVRPMFHLSMSTRFPRRRRMGRGALGWLVVALGAVMTIMACAPQAPTTQPPPSSHAPSVTDPAQESATPAAPSPPSASTPVFTGTREEWLVNLYDCMRSAGWNVTRLPDGGWSIKVPPEQRDAYDAAQATCAAALGPIPTVVPLTEADIRARYEYLVRMRDCLIALGYTISEPPSVEQFVDSWESGPWSPYNDLADQTGPGAWEQANEACPQVPE